MSQKRETALLLTCWVLISAFCVALTWQNTRVPGIYYDETINAAMAKESVSGHARGPHAPGYQMIEIAHHHFPAFVCLYMGAVKAWLPIIPFKLFGASIAVFRVVSLVTGLIALLLAMVWARQLLGVQAAIICGVILGIDPAFLFGCLFDWGGVGPSFVLRLSCFCLAVIWYRQRKAVFLFLAGLCGGLSFFNKVDVLVSLFGAAIAAAISCRHMLSPRLKGIKTAYALFVVGFALTGWPMIIRIPAIISFAQYSQNESSVRLVKLKLALALHDGSYFYRLFAAGGNFEVMFNGRPPVWSPLGILAIIAGIYAGTITIRNLLARRDVGILGFIFLATAATGCGLILLNGAVRIHHGLLLFPWPQLLIIGSFLDLLKRAKPANAAGTGSTSSELAGTSSTSSALVGTSSTSSHPDSRLVILRIGLGVLLLLTATQLWAGIATEKLLARTGGKGWWSSRFDEFSKSIKDDQNLTVVSTDWGFNEQLAFLTDRPALQEPLWGWVSAISTPEPLKEDSSIVYLVHPPEYTFAVYGNVYLNSALSDTNRFELTPYLDGDGQPAFYTIRFRPR